MKIHSRLTAIFSILIIFAVAGAIWSFVTAPNESVYMFVVIIVYSVTVWIMLNKTVAEPAQRLFDIAGRVAEGDLNISNDANENGDLSDLTARFTDAITSVNTLLGEIDKTASAFDKGDTDVRVKATKLKGAYAATAKNVNDMAARLLNDTDLTIKAFKAVGGGDFSAKLTEFPGRKRALNESLEEFRKVLLAIEKDVDTRLTAYLKGEFDMSSSISGYSGNWASVMGNINRLRDSVATPVRELTTALGLLSKGNLSAKVTGDYKGVFQTLETEFNNLADKFTSYIKDVTNVLKEVARENYNVKINERYPGDFALLAEYANKVAKPPAVPKPAPVPIGTPRPQFTMPKPIVTPAIPKPQLTAAKPTPSTLAAAAATTVAPPPMQSSSKKKTVPSMAHIYDQNNYGKY